MPKVAEAPAFHAVLARLVSDYPEIQVSEGARFTWSPEKQQVIYRNSEHNTNLGIFSLLHEFGHALLSHKKFTHDIELLQLEVAAWEKARELAQHYRITLDEDHIQDCLDTYRDWLHLRSTCPSCYARSLQAAENCYHCFNCGTQWNVTRSRLCRPYRLKTTASPLA